MNPTKKLQKCSFPRLRTTAGRSSWGTSSRAGEQAEQQRPNHDVVEGGDDIVGVVDGEVDRCRGQEHPGGPADDEHDRNPTAMSIAVVSQIEPRHMVASQLKTLMPVGTAMMNDMIENQYRLIWPVVNMWWAQTVKE